MASQANNPIAVIRQNLTAMAPEFKAALPDHIDVDKFTRVAMTAIQTNPQLQNADRRSLFGACVRLAQDGLLPDGREAALVMFKDKAQAMPMIAGILKKVRQSGEVSKINAFVVHENDHFKVSYGFDEDVEHIPPGLDKPRGKAIGAYATAVLKDGSRLLEVMSLEEIEAVRKVSRAANNGPWVQWWGEMARKTVMRRLSKRLPMSTDVEELIRRDDALVAPEDAPAPALTVIEGNAAPASKLDALESQIEDAEEAEVVEPETGEVVEVEHEGRSDEQHGDQFTDDDTPAWQSTMDGLRTDLAGAETKADAAKIEKEYLKHAAMLPAEVAQDFEAALAAKKRAIADA